jgi:hypothetical protein
MPDDSKKKLKKLLKIEESSPKISLENGLRSEEWQLPNGTVHRLHGPAVIREVEAHLLSGPGKGELHGYFVNGVQHRTDGPAELMFIEGELRKEVYYQRGVIHRDNAPAELFYKGGKVTRAIYYSSGQKHRNDGPAYTDYDDDGHITCRIWYVNGKRTGIEKT